MAADGGRCQLAWARNLKIVIGIARGLSYLHTELDPPFTTISELNSNSSAVYVTKDFSPKVSLSHVPLSVLLFSSIIMPAI